MPASRVGRVEGGISPTTGQRVAGFIYALGATPRQMLSRPPEFTYRRLDQAVRDAAAQGAQIVGLGAFTKVVGDAGVTVARRALDPGDDRQQSHDRGHARDGEADGATHGVGLTCRTPRRWSSARRARSVRSARGCWRRPCTTWCSYRSSRTGSLRSGRRSWQETPGAHVEIDTTTTALGGRLRPDRHGDVGVRPARARRQPVQARCRHPRRGACHRTSRPRKQQRGRTCSSSRAARC